MSENLSKLKPEEEVGNRGTTLADFKEALSLFLGWLKSQKDKSKLAWTIVSGFALYFGYTLTLEPVGQTQFELPPNIEVPYIETPKDVEGSTTIRISPDGKVLSISGYRIRELEE